MLAMPQVWVPRVDLPIDEIAGLPLHPLIVHAVVVLVPLTAVGLLVMASSGTRSRRYSPAVLFVAAGGAGAAFLAMWSGQELRGQRQGPQASVHFQYGEILPWVALGLFVVVCVLALMDRQGGGNRNMVGKAFAAVAVLLGAGSVVLTVLTGHAGATLVWG